MNCVPRTKRSLLTSIRCIHGISFRSIFVWVIRRSTRMMILVSRAIQNVISARSTFTATTNCLNIAETSTSNAIFVFVKAFVISTMSTMTAWYVGGCGKGICIYERLIRDYRKSTLRRIIICVFIENAWIKNLSSLKRISI